MVRIKSAARWEAAGTPSAVHNLDQQPYTRDTKARGLQTDRMSCCGPTHLGIKDTSQGVRGGGRGGDVRKGEASQGGGVPRERRQWSPAVPRQEVVQNLGRGGGGGLSRGGELRKKRCLLGLGSAGTEVGPGSLHWATRHQPQLAPSAPPIARGQLPQPDGRVFSASMTPLSQVHRLGWEAAGHPDLTPLGRPGQLRAVGLGRSRATTEFRTAGHLLAQDRAPQEPGATETHVPVLTFYQSQTCPAFSASLQPSRAHVRAEKSPGDGWTLRVAVGLWAHHSH